MPKKKISNSRKMSKQQMIEAICKKVGIDAEMERRDPMGQWAGYLVSLESFWSRRATVEAIYRKMFNVQPESEENNMDRIIENAKKD